MKITLPSGDHAARVYRGIGPLNVATPRGEVKAHSGDLIIATLFGDIVLPPEIALSLFGDDAMAEILADDDHPFSVRERMETGFSGRTLEEASQIQLDSMTEEQKARFVKVTETEAKRAATGGGGGEPSFVPSAVDHLSQTLDDGEKRPENTSAPELTGPAAIVHPEAAKEAAERDAALLKEEPPIKKNPTNVDIQADSNRRPATDTIPTGAAPRTQPPSPPSKSLEEIEAETRAAFGDTARPGVVPTAAQNDTSTDRRIEETKQPENVGGETLTQTDQLNKGEDLRKTDLPGGR